MTGSHTVIALLVGLIGYTIYAWLTHTQPASSAVQITASPQWMDSDEPRSDNNTRNSELLSIASQGSSDIALVDKKRPDSTIISCIGECTLIVKWLELSNWQFGREVSPSDRMIKVLRNNPVLRSKLIELATETTSDKRRFIIAAFTELNFDSQRELGKALTQADDRTQRLDGVNLLENPETMDRSVVQSFGDRLMVEQDRYVRGALVKALDQPELLLGDPQTLEVLTRIIETDTNGSVRGEALLVKAKLVENPEDNLADSLTAIRSQLPEYQSFGARALEQIITRQSLAGGVTGNRSDIEIRQLVAELMNPEFDNMPADVRESIDNLYDRFL